MYEACVAFAWGSWVSVRDSSGGGAEVLEDHMAAMMKRGTKWGRSGCALPGQWLKWRGGKEGVKGQSRVGERRVRGLVGGGVVGHKGVAKGSGGWGAG